ncbi:MAG: HAMP domain-containing histidine kinase [Bdellovibrionales bacterium]|nr:HAMP domain-containing histidine kinase [Bdellovibrionales bacterium]
MNNKLGRAPFFTICFFVAVGIFATWQEYYTPITREDFKILATLRIPLLLGAILVAYALRKNPFSVLANSLICAIFLLYTCLGHYFQPIYYACFIQTLFAFSFLFFTSRRLHFVLTTFKAAAYAGFYLYTYDLVKYRQGAETKADFLTTVFIAYGLALIIHHFFTAERGMREMANGRFALLGRHASNIVHDIKGSISIPHLYLQEARKSLDNKDYAQAKEYLATMEKSLVRTEKTIFDLNQLSRLAEGDNQSFKVSEGLNDVLGILAKRLHDVEVKVEGDFELPGDRGVACSVFLNLILNSIENFKRTDTLNPKIEIKINPTLRTITFIDNGGGFSKEALSALKGQQTTAAKASSSGLGLYLVRENLRTLKGKVSFQNVDDGAKVEIKVG